jgi:hypothetical protein
MSADCCCAEKDGCSKTAISACCLPGGSCSQERECDCLEKGGIWIPRDIDPTTGLEIAASCDRCFYCRCCVEEDTTGGLLYRGLGPPTKTPIFGTPTLCPPGSIARPKPLDSQGGCSGTCDEPCDPEVGACCHDCGCAENVTRCQCRALVRAGGPGTQYPGGWRGQGTTCATSCAVCACINKGLSSYSSPECSDLISASFVQMGDCATIQASNPTYYASLVTACAQSGGPSGGGGGGGGPPVQPPTPPRPPQPPAPPNPCSVPADQNPICTAKMWFTVQRNTNKRTLPGAEFDQTLTTILNGGIRFTAAFAGQDICNTFSCCGAPIPSCANTPLGEIFGCWSDTTAQCGGGGSYQQTNCLLECNTTVTLTYHEYCEGVGTTRYPAFVRTTRERKCYEVTQPRDCCNRAMSGEVLVAKPAEGRFDNLTGKWITNDPTYPYKPATAFYVRPRQTCVGYDRTHPTC